MTRTNGGEPQVLGTIKIAVTMDFQTGALRVERPEQPVQLIIAKGLLMEAMRQVDAELDRLCPIGEPSRLWRPR